MLLTLRDPVAWAQSMQALHGHFRTITAKPEMQSGLGKIWGDVMLELVWTKLGDIDDTEALAALFNRDAAAVRETTPASNLLVFDMRQGWDPLCEFLQAPKPETPFPHLNERSGLEG